jgi:hypothetical protein
MGHRRHSPQPHPRADPYHDPKYDDPGPEGRRKPKKPSAQETGVSQTLIDLVDACLTYQPSRRPTFRELKGAIRQAIHDLRHTTGNMGQYLHLARRGVKVDVPQYRLFLFEEKNYKLGMTFPGPDKAEKKLETIGRDTSQTPGAVQQKESPVDQKMGGMKLGEERPGPEAAKKPRPDRIVKPSRPSRSPKRSSRR